MNNFSKLLVANRGEIASRVIRTAKKMGLKTVAIYTEADRHSPYVMDADLSVKIESSYLDSDAIISAAKTTGAAPYIRVMDSYLRIMISLQRFKMKGLYGLGPILTRSKSWEIK